MLTNERGSSLIEMALVLPIMLLVSVVILQFGVAAFAGAAAEAAVDEEFRGPPLPEVSARQLPVVARKRSWKPALQPGVGPEIEMAVNEM